MAVYNAEKTLHRAVDSIIAQTYQNWELIAINDGSSDGSSKILDEYAVSDSRIKPIHKPNGGVASARQTGIDVATGDYIIHADSDDWIEPNMLSEMVAEITKGNPDILICDYFVDKPNARTVKVAQQPKELTADCVRYSIVAGGLMGSLCNKLIKADYCKKTKFYPEINYCEDLLYLFSLLEDNSLKIGYIPKAFYHYVATDSSLTRNLSPQRFENIKRFHLLLPTILPRELRYEEANRNAELSYFLMGFMNDMFSKEEIKREFTKVKDVAYKNQSLRWQIGYRLIELGLPGLAHRFIRF